MEQQAINLTKATFIGIDAHPTEYTALVINRFEEEKGQLRFENTLPGIQKFIEWLPTINAEAKNIVVGIEGGSTARYALVASLLDCYSHVYEVNPVYTKQRRTLGTRPGKSDPIDAKLIAEVLTRKLSVLPKLRKEEMSFQRLCLRRTVWFYEDLSVQTARVKNMLHQLEREYGLARTQEERHVLKLIIQEKRKEQTRIRNLQKKRKGELSLLLTMQGKKLTGIKGVDTILSARIIALLAEATPHGRTPICEGEKSSRYRVIRGGSWGNSSGILRSAGRGWCAPDFRDGRPPRPFDSPILGFRVARTLD